MAITVEKLIEMGSEIVGDEPTVLARYKTYQWINWFNDAQRQISFYNPDACIKTLIIELKGHGTKNEIPSEARRLTKIGLIRNMGADGKTPGKVINGPINMRTQDAINPDWHTESGSYIEEYFYNELKPKEFYVRPYIAGRWFVEGEFSVRPVGMNAHRDKLGLDDTYSGMVVEWAVGRMFERDSELSPNWQRSAQHFDKFSVMSNIKLTNDMAISPKVMEYSKQIQQQGAQ